MHKTILLVFLLLAGLCVEAGAVSAHSLAQGQQYYRDGEYGRAYDCFFALFRNNPGDLELNFLLGRAACGKGDYEAAVMAFERVLLIDPGANTVRVELGKAFFQLGDIAAARYYFREALQGELPVETRHNLQEFLAGIN